MVQASIVAYLVAGTFLSLCYWDAYFTILLTVAAARMHVRAALDQKDFPSTLRRFARPAIPREEAQHLTAVGRARRDSNLGTSFEWPEWPIGSGSS